MDKGGKDTTTAIEIICANSTEARYIVSFYGDSISTIVTSTASVVDRWISEVRLLYEVAVVGLDTEWCLPLNCNERYGPVAVLQLCVGYRCLIFQLAHADYIPQSLKDFLGDPGINFVGVGIEGDARKLFTDFELNVGCKKDLRFLAAENFDRKELENTGLRKLASLVLGVEMEKSKWVTCSKWDSNVLKPKQVKYACIDAFVSYEIGKRLMP